MKQYLQLLMAALLLAACSTNDPTDDDSTIMPANDGYVQNGGVIAKFGDFEADWVINQEVVDHTTMTYNGTKPHNPLLRVTILLITTPQLFSTTTVMTSFFRTQVTLPRRLTSMPRRPPHTKWKLATIHTR